MVEKKDGESENENIEASGDAVLVTQGLFAIADGLAEVAAAIRKLADVEEGVESDSESTGYYMDGNKIK